MGFRTANTIVWQNIQRGIEPTQPSAKEVVPPARIELALSCENWILNPARLPIPPEGQCYVTEFKLNCSNANTQTSPTI
tara:strand:- start:899 stop:1135 length:237 start_codon:yes stop_codon:yes gene_type:complete